MNTVLIVGAGPAGSACGTLLARAGFDVTICEKASFPRDKICGECINPRCWDFFNLLGVSGKLRASRHSSVERILITNSKGKQISARIPDDPSRQFIAIKRRDLDQILVENAKHYGARLLENCQVTNIEWSDGWKVSARIHGDISIFTPGIVIGSDGRNSVVVKQFSMEGTGDDSGPRRVAIQWHAVFQPGVGSSLEMFLFRHGYGGVVNVDESTSNVALVTTPELGALAARDFPTFLGLTMHSNQKAVNMLSSLNPLSRIATTFPINPAIHTSNHPDLYLTGDARQTVEPFTGEGIYFALQDGISTALKILDKRAEFRKTPFWSNHIFSPILKRPQLAELFISAASRIPSIIPFGVKPILG
ncbi:MAG: FAD-dependent monooxygenase [Ignavibacteriales bacterium]|nr:FAD-dependent monooxygenase [Ignavibacteriales bacterium]